MNSPAGLTLLPRAAAALRNIVIRDDGGDCEVGKVTLYVLRIWIWVDKELVWKLEREGGKVG